MLTRKEMFVLMFLALSILVGCAVLIRVSRSPATPAIETAQTPGTPVTPQAQDQAIPSPTLPAQQEVPTARTINVSVAGAVRRPGVYQFNENARVQEAVDSAGGAEEWADLTDINLAAHLIDGTTLTVPSEPEARSGVIRRPSLPPPNPAQYTVSGWQGSAPVSAEGPNPVPGGNGPGLIDLNRATSAELETLPGIGPKLASEIVRFREQQPFRTVDDLDLVSGIGPKRLAAIRDLVTVGR